MIPSFVETTLRSIVLEISTLTIAVDALHHQGYSDNFSLFGNKIISKTTGRIFSSGELIVDEILSCEDEGCEGFYIYALTEPTDQLKGILTILLPPSCSDKIKNHARA